ncbi:tryptophan synthase beta subunit-like PLP-dependent enzyme [Mycena floridula]|nr:tryptophan synthase beta subunit-like PLP-dependent enzyme [Mycena floridula]
MWTENLWQETPLIYSDSISKITGCSAYLKIEAFHPSFSFKYRGISHFAKKAKEEHGPSVHLMIASGGNAALALAVSAQVLGVHCTVFIPQGASEKIVKFLQGHRAEVVVVGTIYAETLAAAETAVKLEKHAVMAPAYDDPTVWEGHSSMIAEIADQLSTKPDAIFCSVGGGGLLGGIIRGCKDSGWDDVPIVTLETIGSNCFHHSLLLNSNASSRFARSLPSYVETVRDDKEKVALAHFRSLPSRAAGSLGASSPAARVVRMTLDREGGVCCVSVPDELAMQALNFVDDHKLLVELACSATLTAGYKRVLFDQVVPPGKDRTVVFVVCGGFKVSFEDIIEYKRLMEEDMARSDSWAVIWGDGNVCRVPK